MIDRLLVHPTAEVHSDGVDKSTEVSQFCVIFDGAKIGAGSSVGSHCVIEKNVTIGERVKVNSGVQIWNGISIANDVFIGPNVTFAKDSHMESNQVFNTVIEDGASIAGGATLMPGITIGKGASIAAGAVVTKSVPANTIVEGNPARVVGYVNGAAETESDKIENVVKLNSVPLRGDQASVSLGASGALVKRLKFVDDLRGNLSVGEFPSDIPFNPKRYFLVFDVPNQEVRGSHAHKECEQFLVCIKGSVNVIVDDGNLRSEVVLDSPDLGVYIPPLVWGTQYGYSEDAVLLVFASHTYDDLDYIRDYDEFQSIA